MNWWDEKSKFWNIATFLLMGNLLGFGMLFYQTKADSMIQFEQNIIKNSTELEQSIHPNIFEQYQVISPVVPLPIESMHTDVTVTVLIDNEVHVQTPKKDLLDVNHASAVELEKLPGIGPVMAASVVRYRAHYGPFQTIDDLTKVPHLSIARWMRIREYVCVGCSEKLNSKSVLGTTALKVNLNSATLEELDQLPGVGAVIAQSIIDYRKTNGPFRSLEELKHIPRIGDKTLDKIRDHVQLE